jgi:hypothetical protein
MAVGDAADGGSDVTAPAGGSDGLGFEPESVGSSGGSGGSEQGRDGWLLFPGPGESDGSNASESGRAESEERTAGTTGVDSDRDGVANATERDLDTDPTRPDTDGDNVTDGRELDLGTDPTASDTDGDGLDDARELELGTDPTAADTDGDGLDDARELELGTDPTAADTDDDRLADARELVVGTDPLAADSDGDGLLDGWERRGETPDGVALPGADPLAKDVYVQVDYARSAERPGDASLGAVADEFGAMPVENPDGSTGIAVHVRDGGRVNRSVSFTGERSNFWTLKERYYRSELGARAGVYHQVLVADFESDQVGYGEVGGEFSVVAADLGNETRQRVVVHELLHNVVGRVEAQGVCPDDPKHYCRGGYLGPRIVSGENAYLAEPVARQLEEDGFSD